MIQKIDIKFVRDFFVSHGRKQDGCKYDFGHILVIAGSMGMLGAGVLTARAAMKTGAGLVSVCVPEGLILPAMTHFVEEMTVCVSSETKYYFDLKSFDFLREYLTALPSKKIDVVAIGNGLGRKEETVQFVQKMVELLSELEIPTIIDADALFAISGGKASVENFKLPVFKAAKKKNIIITPHEKEMQRLINAPNIEFVKKNMEFCCSQIALENGIVCVLKGANSLVSDGKDVFVNTTGNPGMATAGSGDVLTGILAGIKGQHKNLEMLEVAKIGTFLHGLAGDIARDKVGENCLLASDLINCLPDGFKQL